MSLKPFNELNGSSLMLNACRASFGAHMCLVKIRNSKTLSGNNLFFCFFLFLHPKLTVTDVLISICIK